MGHLFSLLVDWFIGGGTKDPTCSHPPSQPQSSRCLADPSPPRNNVRIYPLHVPDSPEKETFTRGVRIIGEHPVALGGYSDIWQGWLKTRSSSTYDLVAVKVLRPFRYNANQSKFAKHFQRELRIWSRLDHENISVFYGIVYPSHDRPAMISPWYQNGSADTYLLSHPSVNPMKLISEITSGVEYLHKHGIIHGDLKGANVMVDDTGHAKLIDFGLSRLLEAAVGHSGFTLSSLSFSIRWCAPELLLVGDAQVTTATDVYSWASTALQLLIGDVPYSSHRDVTVIMMVLNGLSPQRPTSPLRYPINHLDALWELLETCWAEERHRPSISEVRDCLCTFYP